MGIVSLQESFFANNDRIVWQNINNNDNWMKVVRVVIVCQAHKKRRNMLESVGETDTTSITYDSIEIYLFIIIIININGLYIEEMKELLKKNMKYHSTCVIAESGRDIGKEKYLSVIVTARILHFFMSVC